MKYVDEFRSLSLVKKAAQRIAQIAPRESVCIMEVCGTHTQNFRRFGLGKLIPASVRFISGPGCPVCVSSQEYIDRAAAIAKLKDTIVLSFGDMLRVRGTKLSLEETRAEGSEVRVVYSAWDTLQIAAENPQKRVVFLGVGFETTAPGIALTILAARKQKLHNAFFLCSLKLIPPAMQCLLEAEELCIDGFLCPGHVSVIIGSEAYGFIPRRYGIGCCIAGFEPLDMLEGIYILLKQMRAGRPQVANQYIRAVTARGNRRAKEIIASVFRAADERWRGLGVLPRSGLRMRREFSRLDARVEFPFRVGSRAEDKRTKQCRCADILKGLISPKACPLFMKTCKPETPLGPCMVSSEGACNAFYRYRS